VSFVNEAAEIIKGCCFSRPVLEVSKSYKKISSQKESYFSFVCLNYFFIFVVVIHVMLLMQPCYPEITKKTEAIYIYLLSVWNFLFGQVLFMAQQITTVFAIF
jgi:hypothetical protein